MGRQRGLTALAVCLSIVATVATMRAAAGPATALPYGDTLPSRDFSEDVIARLIRMGATYEQLPQAVRLEDITYEQLEKSLEDVVAANDYVDPVTGIAWSASDRDLFSGGHSTWLRTQATHEVFPGQDAPNWLKDPKRVISEELNLATWVVARAAPVALYFSRTATMTTPEDVGCTSRAGIGSVATGTMRADWKQLASEADTATSTTSNYIGDNGVGARGYGSALPLPANIHEGLAQVSVIRGITDLVRRSTADVTAPAAVDSGEIDISDRRFQTPIDQARLLVRSEGSSDVGLTASAFVPSPTSKIGSDDFDAGTVLGSSPGTAPGLPFAVGQSSAFKVPLSLVLVRGASATKPAFVRKLRVVLRGFYLPTAVWPPAGPFGGVDNCAWASSRKPFGAALVVHEKFAPLTAPVLQPTAPAMKKLTAEQIWDKRNAHKFYKELLERADKDVFVSMAEEQWSGESGVVNSPGGGTAVKFLPKVLGVASSRPAVQALGKTPVRVAGKLAALFSIADDIANTVTYTDAYYQYEIAADPPARNYAVPIRHLQLHLAPLRSGDLRTHIMNDFETLESDTMQEAGTFHRLLFAAEEVEGALVAGDHAAAKASAAIAAADAEDMAALLGRQVDIRRDLVVQLHELFGASMVLDIARLKKAERLASKPIPRWSLPLETFGIGPHDAQQLREDAAARIEHLAPSAPVTVPDDLASPAIISALTNVQESFRREAQKLRTRVK